MQILGIYLLPKEGLFIFFLYKQGACQGENMDKLMLSSDVDFNHKAKLTSPTPELRHSHIPPVQH